ncbi:helix-turn-helix domain-containing protein [Candidatus Binatia bacterium]|nr:helix-turn-helix domain-containing protein [Candidatus Binatia bacterium]
MLVDREACYRALRTRDARFDGRFFTGVRSTGVYCRPVCPARTPKLDNCVFLPSAAAAQRAGFRPCLRCRPEVSPDLVVWRGTLNTISRALRLIADGALDDANVDQLAGRIGVGARHLRRLFERHVGASPGAVARTRRLLFAKRLLDETALPITEVAYASGFASVRRFNDAVRRTYGRAPRDLRRLRRSDTGPPGTGVSLVLPCAPPYDWPGIADFLGARAIPGLEVVRHNVYRRTIALAGKTGTVEVRPAGQAPHLVATIRFPDVALLAQIVGRLRRLFDVDADINGIVTHLRRDARLAGCVRSRPGLRVPGCWDGFELAIRAVLGQQVSVAAATTLAGRLVARYGTPLHADGVSPEDPELRFVFPTPAALAAADLTGIGLPRSRAAAITAFSRAVTAEPALLREAQNLDHAIDRLSALPGIGEWTAQYIAMRALREPDAFPASDLGLRRAAATNGQSPTACQLRDVAESWRPWRSYAAMHLWVGGGDPGRGADR